jgi:hypothetical protein
MVQEVKKAEGQNLLGNGLKLVGEAFVPGSAELLEGRLGSGMVHNLLAGVTTLALGGIAPIVAGIIVFGVKADSFSRSVNNQNLWQLVTGATGLAATPGPSEPSPKP